MQKKASAIQSVHQTVLSKTHPEAMQGVLQQGEEAAMDAMGSVVGHTGQQRWLWQALDPQTGDVVASVLGEQTDAAFLQ